MDLILVGLFLNKSFRFEYSLWIPVAQNYRHEYDNEKLVFPRNTYRDQEQSSSKEGNQEVKTYLPVSHLETQ
jgi:hypothetical protein